MTGAPTPLPRAALAGRPGGIALSGAGLAETDLPVTAPSVSGWRHATVQLNDDGSENGIVKIDVAVDGEIVGSRLRIDMSAAPSAEPHTMTLRINGAAPDDILFFRDSLDRDALLAESAAQALARYATAGSYVSPRYVFEAGRFPEGAVVSALAWDGYVPSGRGTIRLGLIGYDAAGSEIGRIALDPWDGTGPHALPVAGLPPLRAVAFTTDMAGDGADTPVLDEVAILYGPPRRRLDAYALR